MGFKGGVFILRNNDWSRKFLELVLTFGLDEGRAREDEMKRTMFEYNSYYYEQNAIVYLLHKYPELRKQVFFERDYDMNRFWKEALHQENSNPFIVNFCSCQFCYKIPNLECIKAWNNFLNRSTHIYFEEFKNVQSRDFAKILNI